MKTSLFFLLISFIGFSQTNFKIDNHQLYWQKVFEYKNITLLDTHLKSNPFTSKLDILHNKISATSNPGKIKAEGLPTYAHRNFTGFIKLDIKENRYRVTISDITFTGIGIEWVEGVTEDSNTILEVHTLENNKIKNNRTTLITLETLDNFFNKTFTVANDSNW